MIALLAIAACDRPPYAGGGLGMFDESPPPEPLTTPTWSHDGEAPGFDPNHDPQPCWSCHAEDRQIEASGHFANPADERTSWDCGPCHTLVAWDDATRLHPVRTPHGTYDRLVPTDPAQWIVSCVPCHPDPDDYRQFACVDCHSAIDAAEGSSFLPHQTPVLDAAEADRACLTCHPAGDLLRTEAM